MIRLSRLLKSCAARQLPERFELLHVVELGQRRLARDNRFSNAGAQGVLSGARVVDVGMYPDTFAHLAIGDDRQRPDREPSPCPIGNANPVFEGERCPGGYGGVPRCDRRSGIVRVYG